MGMIKLTDGYTMIPEGTQVFKIVGVDHDETFGKVKVFMETEKGQKHTEFFTLVLNNGAANEGAMKAFSYFYRTALNDSTIDGEVNTDDLIGHYIECDVKHEEYTGSDGKTKKTVRLGDKRPASGFSGEAPAKASLDLDTLLG